MICEYVIQENKSKRATLV